MALESGAAMAPPIVVAQSAIMQAVLRTAARVAHGGAKVLITGESGVGKDLVARYIHAHSERAPHPFIAINCAGLSETLLESELFGHVRGSFTGAHRDKVGKLRLAHLGTVFLDEVGEMSARMQAVLLRFLENGELQTVGSESRSTVVDVRVIAATNRDLRRMVDSGAFREDLLYRLNVVQLHIPPLRERREDLEMLIEHLLAKVGNSCVLSSAARDILLRYSWPGNVRQLQNVMEQTALVCTSAPITVDDLPAAIVESVKGHVRSNRERRRQLTDDLFEALVAGQYGFWENIHGMFMSRDVTRHDLRQLVRRGLAETQGNHRALLRLFRIPDSDYKRFMNFLSSYDCTVDFREFRPTYIAARSPSRRSEKTTARPNDAVHNDVVWRRTESQG